ncbi:MAG: tyrosine-type recombinase/integrase [Candidatus Nanopelagicales bacterium]
MSLTLSSAAPDFELSLRAANRAPRTIEKYLDSLRDLDRHLASVGHSRAVRDVGPSDIERWMVAQQDRGNAPATVALRFRSVQQFYKWCRREDEVDVDPTAGLTVPQIPEQPVPVLSDSDVAALLTACKGTAFAEARDTAVIRLLLDTGIRRAELLGLRVEDVDRGDRTITVMGKGRRGRTVRYGVKTGEALGRYLRRRSEHQSADLPDLWLSSRGPGSWGKDGVRSMLERRAAQAGLGHIHPHQFRHTFASDYLASGGLEGNLMRTAGWSSRQMLSRYGAAVADERARDARDRLELKGDRL